MLSPLLLPGVFYYEMVELWWSTFTLEGPQSSWSLIKTLPPDRTLRSVADLHHSTCPWSLETASFIPDMSAVGCCPYRCVFSNHVQSTNLAQANSNQCVETFQRQPREPPPPPPSQSYSSGINILENDDTMSAVPWSPSLVGLICQSSSRLSTMTSFIIIFRHTNLARRSKKEHQEYKK